MTTTSKMTTTWHPSHGRRADAVGMLVIRVLPLMLLSSSCSLVDAQSLSSAQNVGIDDVSGSDPTAVDWWRSINQTTTDYLGYHLDELYDWMVVAYVRPKHVGHVFLSCISFFVLSKSAIGIRLLLRLPRAYRTPCTVQRELELVNTIRSFLFMCSQGLGGSNLGVRRQLDGALGDQLRTIYMQTGPVHGGLEYYGS